MKVTLFFFLLGLVTVFAQVNRFVVDDFSVGTLTQTLDFTITTAITTSGAPLVRTSFFTSGGCSGLLGCGRNLKTTVTESPTSRDFTSELLSSDPNNFGFTHDWIISTPKSTKSTNTLTLDGSTDSGAGVNSLGLGGVDFTDGNLATGLRFYVLSDINSTFTVDLISRNGLTCSGAVIIDGNPNTAYTLADIQYDILYSQMTTSCSKTDIGAVVVTVPTNDGVDFIVRTISVIGVANSPSASPSPSVSPSPSIPASASNSPSPSASISQSPSSSPSNSPSRSATPSISESPSSSATPTRTPSATPSESGPCVQFCVCPSFTCAIAYDRDDDVNDVLLNPSATIFIDDDDDSPIEIIREIPGPIRYVYIYVEADSSDDVNVPTFTVPTFTVPTFTIPTFTIPEASSTPTPVADGGNGGNGSSSNDSASLLLSSGFLLVAALFI